MALSASWHKHSLEFITPAGTSRGVMEMRDVWYVRISNKLYTDVYGLGECAPLKGLSIDDREDFEDYLTEVCTEAMGISKLEDIYTLVNPAFPSIVFGMEMAFLDLKFGGKRQYFDNSFSTLGGSIPINGLIWMGSKESMKLQIEEKLSMGFKVLKLKIGAIDFKSECDLLEFIRDAYSPDQLEIRVDANGAFSYAEALEKLNTLSEFHLHSIEQPIKAGQWGQMKRICEKSLVPVALDEELIGNFTDVEKLELLEKIKPAYVILKPSLLGGVQATQKWIELAERFSIGWWVTSALESNVGLNAIAQFTAEFTPLKLPQGLGTGSLYKNNIKAPIAIDQGNYMYMPDGEWEFPLF